MNVIFFLIVWGRFVFQDNFEDIWQTFYLSLYHSWKLVTTSFAQKFKSKQKKSERAQLSFLVNSKKFYKILYYFLRKVRSEDLNLNCIYPFEFLKLCIL